MFAHLRRRGSRWRHRGRGGPELPVFGALRTRYWVGRSVASVDQGQKVTPMAEVPASGHTRPMGSRSLALLVLAACAGFRPAVSLRAVDPTDSEALRAAADAFYRA